MHRTVPTTKHYHIENDKSAKAEKHSFIQEIRATEPESVPDTVLGSGNPDMKDKTLSSRITIHKQGR